MAYVKTYMNNKIEDPQEFDYYWLNTDLILLAHDREETVMVRMVNGQDFLMSKEEFTRRGKG